MKAHSEFFVYELKNLGTGRQYFGRTHNPKYREMSHMRNIASGLHYNRAMVKDHKKHKNWKFSIVEGGLDQKAANLLSDTLAKEAQAEHEERGAPAPYNRLGIKFNGRSRSKNLPQALIEELRALYFTGNYRQVDLAENFNITQGMVSLIVNNLVHNPEKLPMPQMVLPSGKLMRDRHKIREQAAQLSKKIGKVQAYTEIGKEYGVTAFKIQQYVETRPEDVRRTASTANVTHGVDLDYVPAEQPHSINDYLIIDDKFVKLVDRSVKKTAKKLKTRLVYVDVGRYRTAPPREITLDGKKIVLKGTFLQYLQKAGIKARIRRVSEDVYVTRKRGMLKGSEVMIDGKKVKITTLSAYKIKNRIPKLYKAGRGTYFTKHSALVDALRKAPSHS